MDRSRRMGVLVVLAAAAACSDSTIGPNLWPHLAEAPLPDCVAARSLAIALPVGGTAFLDPAVDSGCVLFPANVSSVDSAEYLLVPQSVAGTSDLSAAFRLHGSLPATTVAALHAAEVADIAPGDARWRFDRLLRGLARSRAYGVPAHSGVPAVAASPAASGPPAVGSLRSFKLCKDLTCSGFATVVARAQTIGQHIAIYIDTLAPAGGLDSADLDTLKTLFDARLYPLDTAAFGSVSDIDSNSVAIVLMTPVVNRLVTSTQCHNTGFIAGFFFSGDLDPVFSTQFNHGEIFYSIVGDPTGKLSCVHTSAEVKLVMPSTFTHEFQHMIEFVQHVLVQGGSSEEGWLDEGLSKYAEELAGRSFLPGDPTTFSQYAIDPVRDAYKYLSATGDAPLLIPEDTGSLAEVGASWLFTRFIVDQFGDSLPHRLVNSKLTGAANVAAQTGVAFDTTVTRWALANWVSDLPGFTAPPELQYTKWHFRTTYSSLHTQDPVHFPLAYPLVPAASAGAAVSVRGVLRSGSGMFARALQPPGGASFSVRLRGPNNTDLPGDVRPRLTVLRIR